MAAELMGALRREGTYARSAEELTPIRGDPLSSLPIITASIATLPAGFRACTGGAVGA